MHDNVYEEYTLAELFHLQRHATDENVGLVRPNLTFRITAFEVWWRFRRQSSSWCSFELCATLSK